MCSFSFFFPFYFIFLWYTNNFIMNTFNNIFVRFVRTTAPYLFLYGKNDNYQEANVFITTVFPATYQPVGLQT